MRNANRVLLSDAIKAAALSLALIGTAQGADGIGFQAPRTASPAEVSLDPGLHPWTDSLIGFHPRTDSSARETEVGGPYLSWTDSLKCMTNESYCHRFEAAPAKAGLVSR